MAREHARILTRIWRDPDFRARTPDAQRAYVLLLTQRDVNYAGVLPLAMARWARASDHTSAEDVELAVKELEDHQFVVVDRDTDEVLIRSFIRNDGLIDQPKVLRVALREALAVESEVLREVLGHELARVRLPEGKRGYDGLAEAVARATFTLGGPVDEPVRAPVAARVTEPVAPPVDEPVSRDAGQPVPRDSSNGSGHGSPSRARVQAHPLEPEPETEPEYLSVGGDLGGSRTRAHPREAPAPSASGGPPPPDAPLIATHPVQPCGRAHDPDQACGRCGQARRAGQAAERDADAERLAADRDAERRRRACTMCDADGRLLEVGRFLPVAPATSCDHQTDHRQQVADARDEAS